MVNEPERRTPSLRLLSPSRASHVSHASIALPDPIPVDMTTRRALSGGCRVVVGSMSWPARMPVPTVET